MMVDESEESRDPAPTQEEQYEPSTPFTWVIIVGVVVWVLGAVIMLLSLTGRS